MFVHFLSPSALFCSRVRLSCLPVACFVFCFYLFMGCHAFVFSVISSLFGNFASLHLLLFRVLRFFVPCFFVDLFLCFIICAALLWMDGAGCCSLLLRFPSVGGLVVRREGGGGVQPRP